MINPLRGFVGGLDEVARDGCIEAQVWESVCPQPASSVSQVSLF